MTKLKALLFLLVILTSTVLPLEARENVGEEHFKMKSVESVLSGCTPAKTQTELALNNVRTTILTGGDMWWNLLSAKYEVPKGGGANSLFAGSLWIGGVDAGGQLKVAAATYRQNGNDFWPGPLDLTSVSITTGECSNWDKHFVITEKEVEDFVNGGPMTKAIQTWPGNGFSAYNEDQSMAPFYDKNLDGIYDPGAGDYPKYSLASKKFGCDDYQLFGDQTMWWVFNDKGNIHTETKGNAIGLEIRAQAFAYAATDEVNNMTFYDYQIINRGSIQLKKTYFGQWVDADLGDYSDDYVGCDVVAGVGYCYNGKNVDGSGAAGTYGANPPAIGVDFFRGPKVNTSVNPKDGQDSYGTSFVDPKTSRINMAKFVYYNNDLTTQGNPTKAQDYYNYLSGFWIDGTAFTYGGNAKGGSTVCDFMFPGASDPTGLGTGGAAQSPWTEAIAGNPPGDRRFMQSAGPFTLDPGAVNNVTVGVVWARTTQGGALASIPAMLAADDKAQQLFDNCFSKVQGPDAPDLTIQELDKKLIIYLSNKSTSNNYKEAYREKDPRIKTGTDTNYVFEGYKVYQVTDSSVTAADITNTDKARLIFQCDVKNGVSQIVNFVYNSSLSAIVPTEQVYGADGGITRSFQVEKDLFAKGDDRLVNNKTYAFLAVAYGYNGSELTLLSPAKDRTPYLQGSRNVGIGVSSKLAYQAIPHIVTPEANGTEQHANYGDGVYLTRLEGQGNGGRVLDLTDESTAAILNSGVWTSNPADSLKARIYHPTYQKGAGPFIIKVVDPLIIPSGCYKILITDTTANGRWSIVDASGTVVAMSDTSLRIGSEQIIPSMGISVVATYVSDVATTNAPGNGGVLEATMTFSDPTKKWLSAIVDGEDVSPPYGDLNWIRSGKTTNSSPTESPFNDYVGVDDAQNFEKILGGTWAPYRMCAYSDGTPNFYCQGGPAYATGITLNRMNQVLSSVDIVFTSDKTKWTRCPVLEMGEDPGFTEGNALKFNMRGGKQGSDKSVGASVDKNGHRGDGVTVSTNPEDPGYIAARGMGWFPGYAINIETGERLNMAFGEDSGIPAENGRDMVWNPTSTYFSGSGDPVFGGKHYIYVFAHQAEQKFTPGDIYLPNGLKSVPRYDAGATIWRILDAEAKAGTTLYKRAVYTDAMWVNMPMLSGQVGRSVLETDVKVRIRVARKFRYGYSALTGVLPSKATTDTVLLPTLPKNKNFPMYSFCTNDLMVKTGVGDVAKNALDIINVVPNPYYAYSGYETQQLDNRIKITNLPQLCTIKIYTLNGTLIKTINKDNARTYQDWTLTNEANIPIASGLYIIYVNAPGIGEKVIKWFGVMRPVDLDAY